MAAVCGHQRRRSKPGKLHGQKGFLCAAIVTDLVADTDDDQTVVEHRKA
jgi:hypothetical protein